MIVKFANEKEINYLFAEEKEEYYNGNNRRTLTFEVDPAEIGLAELNEVLNNAENIKTIELTSDPLPQYDEAGNITGYATEKAIHDGYVLKLNVGIENKKVAEETPDAPAEYAERIYFKIGRRTYIEEQLAALGVKI